MHNIHLFREKLTEAFTKELPGPKSHLELAPMERVDEVKRLAKPKNAKESAVLVILFPENEEIHLLLIQRTIYNGAHSGQISFPGGKVEETDVDFIHTALRETEEEIGLSVLSQQIVGKLTNIYIPPSNFVVEPFVAVIDQLNDLKLNFSEVETIYKIPISIFLDDNFIQKRDLISRSKTLYSVPCFVFNDLVIWGATAMILNELISIIKTNTLN